MSLGTHVSFHQIGMLHDIDNRLTDVQGALYNVLEKRALVSILPGKLMEDQVIWYLLRLNVNPCYLTTFNAGVLPTCRLHNMFDVSDKEEDIQHIASLHRDAYQEVAKRMRFHVCVINIRNFHWVLAVVDKRRGTVYFIDPLKFQNPFNRNIVQPNLLLYLSIVVPPTNASTSSIAPAAAAAASTYDWLELEVPLQGQNNCGPNVVYIVKRLMDTLHTRPDEDVADIIKQIPATISDDVLVRLNVYDQLRLMFKSDANSQPVISDADAADAAGGGKICAQISEIIANHPAKNAQQLLAEIRKLGDIRHR